MTCFTIIADDPGATAHFNCLGGGGGGEMRLDSAQPSLKGHIIEESLSMREKVFSGGRARSPLIITAHLHRAVLPT